MVGEREVVTPTVQELCKPVETNLRCVYKDCGRTFLHRPALNMHLTQTHKLEGYGDHIKHGTHIDKPKSVYLCPVHGCPRSSLEKSFPTLRQLRQHYDSMHAEKTLPCSRCQKKFATAAQLKTHEESCGRTFVCAVCHVPFATKEGVAKHQRNQHPAAYHYAKYLIKQQRDSKPAAASSGGDGSSNGNPALSLPSNIISSEVANAPICADRVTFSGSGIHQFVTDNDSSQSAVNPSEITQSAEGSCSNLTITGQPAEICDLSISIGESSNSDHSYSLALPLPNNVNVTNQSSNASSSIDQSANYSHNTNQSGSKNHATSQSISNKHNSRQLVQHVKKKYARLLPKPSNVRADCMTQTYPWVSDDAIHSSMETCATQTDMLGSAIKTSGLLLQSRKVMTGTNNIPHFLDKPAQHELRPANLFPVSANTQFNQRVRSGQNLPGVQYSQSNLSVNPRPATQNTRTSHWNVPVVGNDIHDSSRRPTIPVEFGTQAPYMEPEHPQTSYQLQETLGSTLPIEFGTQTLSMDIVDNRTSQQSSNTSLRSSTPTQFGSQTLELNSEASRTLRSLYDSIRSSPPAEYGTQTSFLDFESTSNSQVAYYNNSPTEFGTQTSFMEGEGIPNIYCNSHRTIGPSEFGMKKGGVRSEATQSVSSNTELGTQTIFSALLEEMGSSSTSIELQCDLGEASLQLPDAVSSSSLQDMMSFGTQTIYAFSELESIPSVMSSFGTQTSVAPNPTVKHLEIPESSLDNRPFPRQSTSDFAMQFPYELMNFGTQTPLPSHAEFVTSKDFNFEDDDLLASGSGERLSATLSQSSTQTDLDFLFNNIETQTENWPF